MKKRILFILSLIFLMTISVYGCGNKKVEGYWEVTNSQYTSVDGEVTSLGKMLMGENNTLYIENCIYEFDEVCTIRNSDNDILNIYEYDMDNNSLSLYLNDETIIDFNCELEGNTLVLTTFSEQVTDGDGTNVTDEFRIELCKQY